MKGKRPFPGRARRRPKGGSPANARGEAGRGSEFAELDSLRVPLFAEMARLRSEPSASSEPQHLCCKRERNQMRISPLEAHAIARAFRRDPALRSKLPQVLERVRAEVAHLKRSGHRQNFECPLLDGTSCLVHERAKPMGCLAWNPGRDYSEAGWKAFRERDGLNDRTYGPNWTLRVIPLWLARVFSRELRDPG